MSIPVAHLTEELARAIELDATTLRQRVRLGREAGQISKWGQGRAAARATDLDGARMILMAFAVDRTVETVETVDRYSTLVRATHTDDIPELAGSTFIDALLWMLRNAKDDTATWKPRTISFNLPPGFPSVRVDFGRCGSFDRDGDVPICWTDEQLLFDFAPPQRIPWSRSVTVWGEIIGFVANLIGSDRDHQANKRKRNSAGGATPAVPAPETATPTLARVGGTVTSPGAENTENPDAFSQSQQELWGECGNMTIPETQPIGSSPPNQSPGDSHHGRYARRLRMPAERSVRRQPDL
jgi:hypothetical protein